MVTQFRGRMAVSTICIVTLSIILSNIAGVISSAGASYDPAIQAPLTVQTASGILHGAVNESIPLVRQWLGVPYAAAPVGSLRFLKAQNLPADAAAVERDVSTWAPSCWQYQASGSSLINTHMRHYLVQGSYSEDCLTVSIWAPLQPKKEKAPVFIWIHGGGSTIGGASVPFQNPSKWVQRSQAHIVVAVQYRLNFFGNPQGPGQLNDQLGFSDIRKAMEWCRDNIEAFGGDPHKMILWGHSAGSDNVARQHLANLDEPIVSGYIMNSGNALTCPTFTENKPEPGNSNFEIIAEAFRCPTDVSQNMIDCVKEIPAGDLIAYIQYHTAAGVQPPLTFPTGFNSIDTWSNSTERLLQGKFTSLPMIISHTDNEGANLVGCPVGGTPDAAQVRKWNQFVLCTASAQSQLRSSMGLTTYRMAYRGNFSSLSPQPWMRAYHGSELPMIGGSYGDHQSLYGEVTPEQVQTSEKIQDMYLAFAEDPQHGPAAQGWPQYSDGQMAVFGGLHEMGSVKPMQIIKASEVEDAACTGFILPAARSGAFDFVDENLASGFKWERLSEEL